MAARRGAAITGPKGVLMSITVPKTITARRGITVLMGMVPMARRAITTIAAPMGRKTAMVPKGLTAHMARRAVPTDPVCRPRLTVPMGPTTGPTSTGNSMKSWTRTESCSP